MSDLTGGRAVGTAANDAQGIQIKFMSLSGGKGGKVAKGRRKEAGGRVA